MKTISLSVSEVDYESFREASARTGRPIAELIREAMATYRAEKLESRPRLTKVRVLTGHRLVGELPSRVEIQDEILDWKFGKPGRPRRTKAKGGTKAKRR